MRRIESVRVKVAIFMLTFVVLQLCLTNAFAANLNKSDVQVVCTIPDFVPIVKAIGGKYVKVSSVMPAGCDPHAFTVSAKTLENLSKAKLIVLADSNLISFEGRIKKNFEEKCLDINNYTKFGLKLDNFPGYPKCPHGYWLKLSNGIAIAKAVEEKLSKLEPENTAYFKKNLDKFERNVTIAEERIIENSKVKGDYCVAAVPGVCYIAENSGMKVGAVLMGESAGFASGKEIAKIEEMMSNGKYKCIILPEFMKDTRVGELASQISEDCNKPVVYVKFAMAKANDTYVGIAYYNAEKLNSISTIKPKAGNGTGVPGFTVGAFIASIVLVVLYRNRGGRIRRME